MKTLAALFFCCILKLLPAQQVTVANINCSNATYGEAACMAVRFDVQLKQTYNELLQTGDSAGYFVLEVRLKDGAGNWLLPAKGYGSCADTAGYLRVTVNMPLSYESKIYAGQTVMIPYAAIGLEEGFVKLQPVVLVTDKWGHRRSAETSGAVVDCLMPSKLHLNLSVREILVAETDAKNQTWDYKLPNAENDAPEVCWSIIQANKKLCTSPFKPNDVRYTDEEGKNDYSFTISRGDVFVLQVLDYDLNSYSDKIGSMKVDMNDMEKFSGSSFTSKFGKVIKMEFVITIL